MQIHPTLEDALAEIYGECPEGSRPYEVTIGKETKYVVTNSQGQAAQAVCKVRTCTTKEQMEAMQSLLKRRTNKPSTPAS